MSRFKPMKDYKERGLFCEYEYCIEEQDFEGSPCPVWGHSCPGGDIMIEICGKTIEDIPEKRWAIKECDNCKSFCHETQGKKYYCGLYSKNKDKGSFYCNDHQFLIKSY